MYKSQKSPPVLCALCKHQIYIYGRYCCDPLKLACIMCESKICKKCNNKRTNVKYTNNKSDPELKIKKETKRCNGCRKSEFILEQVFFDDSSCHKSYCHDCMIYFYEQHSILAKQMSKNGESIDLQVELECGCQFDLQTILAFLSKYCFDCSKKIEEPYLELKNGLKVMKKCFQKLQRSNLRSFQTKRQKELFQTIQQNFRICSSCDMKIDGTIRKLGNVIDNIFLCEDCFKQTQLQSSKIQQSIVQKSSKNSERKRSYAQEYCQSCQIELSINRIEKHNAFCEKCESKFDEKRQSRVRYFDQKEKKLSKTQENIFKTQFKNRQVKKKQKQVQETSFLSVIKSSNKKDITEQMIPIHLPKQSPSKTTIFKQLKESTVAEVKEQKSILSQSYENISMIEQEQPLKQFDLAIVISEQEQAAACSKCKYLLNNATILQTYEREEGNPKTTRIVQSEEERNKYIKRVKFMCLNCYWKLKDELKRNEIFEKKQYKADSYARIYKSAAKPAKPMAAQPKSIYTSTIGKKQKPIALDIQNPLQKKSTFTYTLYDKASIQQKKCIKCKLIIHQQTTTHDMCFSCRIKRDNGFSNLTSKCPKCGKQKILLRCINCN